MNTYQQPSESLTLRVRYVSEYKFLIWDSRNNLNVLSKYNTLKTTAVTHLDFILDLLIFKFSIVP